MRSNKKGFMLLDCVLGATLLAISSIFILESTATILKWTKSQSIKLEIQNILNSERKMYELGNKLNNKSGSLLDGTPFEITITEDIATMPPFEKANIYLKLDQGFLDKEISTIGIRLRR